MKTTRVGKSWFVPGIKSSKTASFFNEGSSRSEYQVVGIGQNCLRTKIVHFLHCKSLDGGFGGGADESGSLNISVWSMNSTDPSETRAFFDGKNSAGGGFFWC